MKTIDFSKTEITGGFLKKLEELNRKVTINAVYDRFYDTGRVTAFKMDWKAGMPKQPHIFWDSDIAKWIEGAAYILAKHPEEKDLEAKIEELIDDIGKGQCEDGYFNIYFTVCEPEKRFTDRNCHELYCAGHLMEAALAYAQATCRTRFLGYMEKYADYIRKVFMEDQSASFVTPGHEEIELALVKMYKYTGKKKYLDLAAFFINKRGSNDVEGKTEYNQSQMPVRDLSEAEGHSVRAVYLYSAMADLAKELGDKELFNACGRLFENITEQKMYVTGGIGSCCIGETFSKPFDLPNSEAYTETCAGIGLMFFANRMLALDNDSKYADVIERAFYNGVLSGLSLDGKSFFYENPLEITMLDHFTGSFGSRRYPITQRVECFDCSCCPPNINRLLSSLGNYLYGIDGSTLYVNQFAESSFEDGGISCKVSTDYPVSGTVKIFAKGASKVAVRIPSWCAKFEINKPYEMFKGYALVSGEGETAVTFDMTPFAVRASVKVQKDVGLLSVQRGPVVYCAESVDNGANLHALAVSHNFTADEKYDDSYGLMTLEVSGYRLTDSGKTLYTRAAAPCYSPAAIKMIPYRYFANRGESDMLVWLREK